MAALVEMPRCAGVKAEKRSVFHHGAMQKNYKKLLIFLYTYDIIEEKELSIDSSMHAWRSL